MADSLVIALVILANAYILTALTMLPGPFNVFENWRERFIGQEFWYKLFHCPYCLGFWTSGVWAALTVWYLDIDAMLFVVLWLAYASASATIAEM